MTRLGKRQLATLGSIGRPTSFFVLADKETRSLCRRGLAVEWSEGGMVGITPAGLRALAAAMEAGRIAAGPDLPPRVA